MGYSLNAVQAEAVLQALKQNYSVYAPKRFPKQGRYSDTDVIKYAEVEHYEDIVWQVKSDYPAKEVLTPIQQAIFYFTEDEYRASKGPQEAHPDSGPPLRHQRPACAGEDLRGQWRLYGSLL